MSKAKSDWSDTYKKEHLDYEVYEETLPSERKEKKAGTTVRRRGERRKERTPSPERESVVRRRGDTGKKARSPSPEKRRPSSSSSRRRDKEEDSGSEDDRRPSSSSRSGRSHTRRTSVDLIEGRQRIEREDEEYDQYQDRMAKMSKSEAADIILYVKRDRKDPSKLDINSHAASALARNLGSEVYEIIIDDIDPHKKKPGWLVSAPTVMDRLDKRIYRGAAAVNFLKSVIESTPADYSRGHSSFGTRVDETWVSAQGTSRAGTGYGTRKKKVSRDEFVDYLNQRESQDRNLSKRQPRRGRDQNLPSIRADADLTEEMRMKAGLNPVYRQMLANKIKEHQYQLALRASQRQR